ncbi:sensor histidine kinase [Demequina litorisediminis]|uniref:histidine kinase n=1 Tax=Demequina litorisediminis TaxID=1849022 RepID=A0ABQ6I9G9_9MICO|nr:sensor histidine kinase [Demequina litorisediminis]GMA34449.1 two-component sensor histidine kinase [Demequina litorisediminis]
MTPRPYTGAGLAGLLVVLLVMLAVAWTRSSQLAIPPIVVLIGTVLAWLPLLFASRHPLAAFVIVAGVETAVLASMQLQDSALSTPEALAAFQPVPLASMAAQWILAMRSSRVLASAAGIAAAVWLGVMAAVVGGAEHLVGAALTAVLILLTVVVAGIVVAVRERRDEALRRQARETADAVVAERLLIAREIHDGLAHSLTLVKAQASVAEYLMDKDPVAAHVALRSISDRIKEGLRDLRSTLDLLRDEGASSESPRGPAPSLTGVEALVARFADARVDVVLDVVGEPRALSSQVDTAAYRVVQEALTNAAKHAPGARVRVTFQWDHDQVVISIENGPGATAPTREPSGHGLVGMRERVRAAGGVVLVGPQPGGGFRVRATLPVMAVHDSEAPTRDWQGDPHE